MQLPAFWLPPRTQFLAIGLGAALLLVCGAGQARAATHGSGLAANEDAVGLARDAFTLRESETCCSEDLSRPALIAEPALAVNANAPFLGTSARSGSAFAGVQPLSAASPSGNAEFSSPPGTGVVKGSSLLKTSTAAPGSLRPANQPAADRRISGTLQTVPEPSSILLSAAGLTVVVITRRRRR